MQGKQEFEVNEGVHRISVVSTFPLLVSFNDTPVKSVTNGKFVVRSKNGIISIDPSEPKKPYKFEIEASRPTQDGEAFDDIPPPDPAPPSNYLQAMRQKVRQQMGVIREDFASHRSQYEIGEAEPLFEEEEQQKREEASKRAAQAELEAEGSNPSENEVGDPEPAERLSEPKNNPPE